VQSFSEELKGHKNAQKQIKNQPVAKRVLVEFDQEET